MALFENIRIGYKLTGGFFVISVIMIMIAIFGVVNMNLITGNGNIIYEKTLLPVHTMDKLDAGILKIRGDILRYTLFPSERSDLRENVSSMFILINSDLKNYRDNYSDSENSGNLERLSELLKQLEELYQPVMATADKGRQSEAVEALTEDGKQVVIRTEILSIIDSETSKALKNADNLKIENNNTAYSSTLIFILVTIGAVIASLVFGLFISRSITIPLGEVVGVAGQIGQGISSARVRFSRSDEIGILGLTLNKMGEHISAMVADTQVLSLATQKGELSVRSDPSLHEGDYRLIIIGINTTLDAVIGPLNVAAEYVDRISKGDIPAEITDQYYGDFNEIKNNLNTCISAVNLMVEDASRLTQAAIKGDLSTRADSSRHTGDFKIIVEGVNATLDAVIGPLNVAAEYVDRIAKGDIPAEITDQYFGDFNEIKNNLNTCIRAINILIEDSNRLTESAVKGELSTRVDPSRHTGDFKVIVEGVNATLDAVIEPVHEAMRVSQEFALGNFTARLDESLQVKGDFVEFKNALNRIGIELTRMMTMINEELFESVNVLSAASSEIMSMTAELSSGTAQTATSVNETSATVEEVRKTTEVTNNKAKNVAEKSMAVSQVALTGRQSVEEILSGMTHIQQQMESIAGSVVKLSEQSQAIGEIIATVTDIAEQSNLLAVNASIEAAKAGEYGRGFGVVAQEIKNLAEQSKLATTHIRTILTDIQRGISSTVISTEQGTKTVATGLRLSNEAKDAISVLSQSISEAAKSSAQITASSQEQVVGMDQISSAMESIRMAAQNNLEVTRQVEKTAKDLHDLGIALKQITERFKL
ncbi:MAG: methyl-accepting chemotaxis protein [Methanobacteriota archaeon]